MSVQDKEPNDPFSSVNLDDLLDNNEPKPGAHKTQQANVEIDKIKEAASLSHFSSRQVDLPKKQELLKKSVSIFANEENIVVEALNAHKEILRGEFGTASQSDVYRAALHLLAEKPLEEQARLIAKHKGRGRN